MLKFLPADEAACWQVLQHLHACLRLKAWDALLLYGARLTLHVDSPATMRAALCVS